MRLHLRANLVFLALFITPRLIADFVYTVDFNGPNLDSRLFVENSPQYGARLAGTQLELFKEEGAGAGSGIVNVYSSFFLTGDYSVTLRAHRGLGKASAGLGMQSLTGHYQAMYLTGQSHLWASRCHPEAGCDSRGTVDAMATNVVLRIRREGARITSEYDAGDGFVTLLDSDLAGFDAPMRLKLFLLQEEPGAYPPPYTDAATALYDDLRFESQGVDGFVPGTYSTLATISRDLQVCWTGEPAQRYQLQWAPVISAGNWLNVGGPVTGTGSSICASEVEAAEAVRFYRIETLPE